MKIQVLPSKIQKEPNIFINDLHAYALLGLPKIQRAKDDVHFSADGYAYLAQKVAEEIAAALPKGSNKKD